MTQDLLSLPHDSAEEPPMASMQEMDPAALQEIFVDGFNTRHSCVLLSCQDV